MAIAVVLGHTSAQQRTLARASTAQMQEALATRQLLNVLDFVLHRAQSLEIALDPRLAQYQQLTSAQAETGKSHEDILEQLRQLLGAMGMELDLERDPEQEADALQPTESAGDGEGTSAGTGSRGVLRPFYRPSRKDYALRVDDQDFAIAIWPINARPSLNGLPYAPLRRYLVYLGLSEDAAARLAGALVDWRDADDFVSDSGAEFEAYTGKGYRPRNGPFRSWQELAYVKGCGPSVRRLLRGHFVLHGNHKKVLKAHLTPGELASLAGVPESHAALALDPKSQDWQDSVPLEDVEKITAFMAGKPDPGLWLVRIQWQARAVQAVVAPETKRLLELSVDGLGPIPERES